MRTRIYNAKILTMEKGREIFEGEIEIEDGRITAVKEVPAAGVQGSTAGSGNGTDWDEVIDAQGNLVMPGFKNAHTHSPMTFLRSYADDMKLQEWLFDKVFPAEAKLTGDDIYWLTKLAVMEYLTSGITAAFDMYKLKNYSADAVKETGFRMVFCGDINDFGGTVEDVENDYLHYNKEDRLSYRIGFHAEYTTSRELMEELQNWRTNIRSRCLYIVRRREKRWRSAGRKPE